MPKKKVTQEGPAEAPVNQDFSEAGAAQEAAAQGTAATRQEVASQTKRQDVVQIPPDLTELIRSTLSVVIAQRKTHGLAITLTALVNILRKSLERYLKRVPTYALREYVRGLLTSMGYLIVEGLVEYKGEVYKAEIVVLYRSYDELVDMIKMGRMNSFIKSLISNEVAAPYDKVVKHV